MPFDEEDDLDSNRKIGLKKVSSQKSMFDEIPKKPTAEDFQKKVTATQEKSLNYKQRASELAIQFKKICEDKTLVQNKSVFASEIEKEVLSKMVELAIEINNDPNEQEGMGSLSWITLLMKVVLSQRERINVLEYNLSLLEKKLEPSYLSNQIIKELRNLDKEKKNE